jgi:hypothetical protein
MDLLPFAAAGSQNAGGYQPAGELHTNRKYAGGSKSNCKNR